MRPDDVQTGTPLSDVQTPALLLDIGSAERNLRRMVDFLADKPVSLRPHVKLFRATPQLARMQLEAGAIGVFGVDCGQRDKCPTVIGPADQLR